MDWGKNEMGDPMAVVVDHLYQRQEKPALIQRIAANFDPMRFGRPICFQRESTMIYCVDGQQRLAGAKAAGLRSVPLVVYPLVGIQREAEVFVAVNHARDALSGIEKHRGRIVAKENAAIEIERAVATAGFSIASNSDSPRAIAAIGALEYAHYHIAEDGIVQMLTVAREAWGDDKKLTKTAILRTLSDIIEEQRNQSKGTNGGYSRPKLTAALRRTTPAQLLRKAEEIHFEQGTAKRESLRRAFTALAKV